VFIETLQGRKTGVDHRGQGEPGVATRQLEARLRASSPAAPGCRYRSRRRSGTRVLDGM